jgi:hypothetical protein
MDDFMEARRVTEAEANEIVLRCIVHHLGKRMDDAQRWFTSMGPTYQAEAMRKVMAGMHTPERLFDTVIPWRLFP